MAMPRSSHHIPIGLIGTAAFIGRAMNVIHSFPSFRPFPKTIAGEREAADAALGLAEEVEVLLVGGPALHRRIKERVSASMPVHYVPVTDAGLNSALFRAMRAGLLQRGVSTDSLTDVMIKRTLRDLEIEHLHFVNYDGPAYASADSVAAFHADAYSEGRTSVAVTAVEAVAERLRARGIPCELLHPSDQDIVVALERALLSTETRRSKEAQIVVGMINVDHFGKLTEQRSSEHEIQKLKLDIHRLVLDYVESLDGYMTHIGGDEYLFFTTRGIFERETGGYKTIPLAKDAGKNYGITFSIGMGFGNSANEAGTHARTALRKSKEAGGNTCFIVREDGTIIGPLETAEPIRSALSLTDPALIKRAEDAGMTSAYLSRLLAQAARTGKLEYQVHELAALLDITVRSCHRLLQQWVDNGLVEIVGSEKVPKGRPRQIFRFAFLEGHTASVRNI
jgi:hypothetical protein